MEAILTLALIIVVGAWVVSGVKDDIFDIMKRHREKNDD